jgi:hypothetical protein
MKHAKLVIYYTLLLLFIVGTFYGCSNTVESEPLISSDEEMMKTIETLPKEELNTDEETGLVFMREEEKLARDVYITLYQTWNQKVFNNISKSEQKHTDAIKMLLDKYDLEDPMEVDEFGVFKNEDLQNLYNSLIETGKKSLIDALKVGAAIEEIDILDLIKYKEKIDNEDIIFVYDNLTRGSRNHLRAYVKNLENQGVIYTAQYMVEEDFLVIINSAMERGNKGSKGKGNNRGHGKGKGGNGHGHRYGWGN